MRACRPRLIGIGAVVVSAGAPAKEVNPTFVGLADVGIVCTNVAQLVLGETPSIGRGLVLQVALAEAHLKGRAHREKALREPFWRFGVWFGFIASAVAGQSSEGVVFTIIVFRLIQRVSPHMVLRLGQQPFESTIEGFVGNRGGKVAVGGYWVFLCAPANAKFGNLGRTRCGDMAAALRRDSGDFGGRIGGHLDFNVVFVILGVFATREGRCQHEGKQADSLCSVHCFFVCDLDRLIINSYPTCVFEL